MPIATMGQYEKSHWDRVRIVLDEAIEQAGYIPRLVSESEDIGVIHARIVQNLYDDPIVVCDVSGKNANVMFELGLRLAFDKPTIVVKDDLTDYSFDTSPIEHIGYRSDLRFDDVRDFRKRVAAAIIGSVAKKEKNEKYSPFLGHFGKFKITGIDTREVASDEFIIGELKNLRLEINRMSSRSAPIAPSQPSKKDSLLHKLIVRNLAEKVLREGDFDLTTDHGVIQFIASVENEIESGDTRLSEESMQNIYAHIVSHAREGSAEPGSLF